MQESAVVAAVTEVMSAVGRYHISGDLITVTWNQKSMSAPLQACVKASVTAQELLRKLLDNELS